MVPPRILKMTSVERKTGKYSVMEVMQLVEKRVKKIKKTEKKIKKMLMK